MFMITLLIFICNGQSVINNVTIENIGSTGYCMDANAVDNDRIGTNKCNNNDINQLWTLIYDDNDDENQHFEIKSMGKYNNCISVIVPITAASRFPVLSPCQDDEDDIINDQQYSQKWSIQNSGKISISQVFGCIYDGKPISIDGCGYIGPDFPQIYSKWIINNN